MLLGIEMLRMSDAQGDSTFRFDVENATQEQLKKAIVFEETYSELYGHQIFVNLDEIKQALK